MHAQRENAAAWGLGGRIWRNSSFFSPRSGLGNFWKADMATYVAKRQVFWFSQRPEGLTRPCSRGCTRGSVRFRCFQLDLAAGLHGGDFSSELTCRKFTHHYWATTHIIWTLPCSGFPCVSSLVDRACGFHRMLLFPLLPLAHVLSSLTVVLLLA